MESKKGSYVGRRKLLTEVSSRSESTKLYIY
jgi:hypothetical protein